MAAALFTDDAEMSQDPFSDSVFGQYIDLVSYLYVFIRKDLSYVLKQNYLAGGRYPVTGKEQGISEKHDGTDRIGREHAGTGEEGGGDSLQTDNVVLMESPQQLG